MSKEQRALMDSKDKLASKVKNPLTRLFRNILARPEMKVTSLSWNHKLTTWLKSDRSGIPNNSKDIGQERNNFNRAIAKDQITFRSFNKALEILEIQSYSMTITLKLATGETIEVDSGPCVFNHGQIKTRPGLRETLEASARAAEIVESTRVEKISTDDNLDRVIDEIPDAEEQGPWKF